MTGPRAEAYLILGNDRDEIWFISNRHLRTWELRPEATALRIAMAPNATVAHGAQGATH